MRRAVTVLALPLAFGVGACGDVPVAPEAPAFRQQALALQQERPNRGTGLVLENFVRDLPLVGDVQVTQVEITEFSTFLGGLRASGTITGIVTATGLTVTDEFTTDVLVSSTGSGCELVKIEFPTEVNVFNVAGVEIPEATVEGRGTGPVGTLLCNLTRAINTVAGGVVGGLVNALNALLR